VSVSGVVHPAIAEDGVGLSYIKAMPGANVSDFLLLDSEGRRRVVEGARPCPAETRLLAPLRPKTIVAIGLNYEDHIRETGMDRPTKPLVFSKLRTSVIGPDDVIRVDPGLTSAVDWEVELAVVIGALCRNVRAEDALSFVFGYTVGNDVSARDIQFSDGQWVRGKSLDTFCPLGPVVVTSDAIGDPQELPLSTRVNGVVVQDSTTASMIFGVAELISFCSHSFSLEPGDVILTGTPWGCGAFMQPPQYLGDGDVVEVAVEGIGTLRNPVAAVTQER
jgi:2-keto-4-pentenoate hydratase/2-oxohepta-3-ene-1,7-dioic acid hydratase in catechol pathway